MQLILQGAGILAIGMLKSLQPNDVFDRYNLADHEHNIPQFRG